MRYLTSADIQFFAGLIQGKGQDLVGKFVLDGAYRVEDGGCYWEKQYLGQHNILYQGYCDGVNLSGRWRTTDDWSGDFSLTYVGE